MNKKLIMIGFLVMVGAVLVVGTALAALSPGCTEGPFTFGANGLAVKKDVCAEKALDWTWSLLKSADQTDLTLALGQTIPVNYTVTASAISTGVYSVSGNIFVQNLSGAPVTINSVTDALGVVDACDRNGIAVTFPYTLPASNILHCTYSGSSDSMAATNTATVTDSAGVSVSGEATIDWANAPATETDECIDITDTLGGSLGTVCAGSQTTFTKTYIYDVVGGTCGESVVENIASFLTNDNGETGSSTWVVNVNVPCDGGCTLTPGYWKTHSMYGPAPYDDTWAQIGEDTTFFLSGASYYNVLWTSPSGGNAYYILAHAYIASELNFLNGASVPANVQTAFDAATDLFNTSTPAQIAALRGNSPVRAQFIALAGILDDYNNGLFGPGHCSEPTAMPLSVAYLYASNWVYMPNLVQ